METNETILTREVVVLDSHKRMGSVKGLRVDCETQAVSHYIVNNAGTGSVLVLPFDKALAVGDTFVTVQSREDFLPAGDAEAAGLLQDGYVLIDEEVFTKTGNRLSKVKGYEFDTVFGKVTRLDLEDQSSFASDTFVFFSPDFIFVDDGTATAGELRSKSEGGLLTAGKPGTPSTATASAAPAPAKDASSGAGTFVSGASDAAPDTDAEIKEFLIGATITTDIASDDGKFKLKKGTILTPELVKEAEEHDALLLLTINVDV